MLIKAGKAFLLRQQRKKQAERLDKFVRDNEWVLDFSKKELHSLIYVINFDPNNLWYIEEALQESTNELLLEGVEQFLGINERGGQCDH